eukprot:Opistho-2@85690
MDLPTPTKDPMDNLVDRLLVSTLDDRVPDEDVPSVQTAVSPVLAAALPVQTAVSPVQAAALPVQTAVSPVQAAALPVQAAALSVQAAILSQTIANEWAARLGWTNDSFAPVHMRLMCSTGDDCWSVFIDLRKAICAATTRIFIEMYTFTKLKGLYAQDDIMTALIDAMNDTARPD